MATRWAVTDYEHLDGYDELEIEAWSDIPVHMTMRWTDTPPQMHLREVVRRGEAKLANPKFCFVAWNEIEQLEPGDTTLHTFLWPGWTSGQTRWSMFVASKDAAPTTSNTGIFTITYEGATSMLTLGKLGEAQVLLGNVKLAEGDNISIVRDDINNALRIHAQAISIPWDITPKLNWLLEHIPAGSFGYLSRLDYYIACRNIILQDDLTIFQPYGKSSQACYQIPLTSLHHIPVTSLPATCVGQMLTPIQDNRYISYPNGNNGTVIYTYDAWRGTWTTSAAITALGAGWRMGSSSACLWDGSDYIYIIGATDGATKKQIARYSISGDSWTALTPCPTLAVGMDPNGMVELVGDNIYCHIGGASVEFWRYNITGDTWTRMADTPAQTQLAGGLLQSPEDLDKLILFSFRLAHRVDQYSIAGDAWAALPVTNPPTQYYMCKGIYRTSPASHVLFTIGDPTQSIGELWLYKMP